MSKSNRSYRFIVLAIATLAVSSVAIAANWGGNFAGFSLFSKSAVAESTDRTPALQPFTIGSCDTAGPIEIESTGGTVTPTAYATLTAAFAAINGGTHTGSIAIEVCGNTDELTGTALLNASGSGSSSYTDISIKPVGGAARTIAGATTAGSPLIDFSGADNVTVDGLNTGGNSLTIENTTASATSATSTIRFIGGATNNTITNSNLKGAKTASVATNGAVVTFSTDAVTANGNDNNTISNNNIGPSGANLPTTGIQCNGSTTTTAIGNSGIVINNNNIFDFFGAAVTSAGVTVNGGCNGDSITNNRFYQTATRTQTTASLHTPILMNSSTATSGVQGMTITGNIIGYASNAQTGTYSLTGAVAATFNGIRFLGITGGTVSNINNNTVANISLTGVTSSGTSSSSPMMGIFVSGGTTIVNSNTIGSQSATGSITYSSSSTSASDVDGIFNFGSDNWTTNNNIIGGITAANTSTGAANVYGLRVNTGSTVTWTCTGNTVGGTVANSLQSTSAATGSIVNGILNSNPIGTITGNTVRNLSAAGGTGTTSSASINGIVATTAAVQTVSQNTLSTFNSAGVVVNGITATGAGSHTIARNKITDLNSSNAAGVVSGLQLTASGASVTIANNLIGALTAPLSSVTSPASSILGINLTSVSTSSTINAYFNSIYINATSSGANFATTGIFHTTSTTATTAALNLRNNVIVNTSTPTGTGLTVAYRRSAGAASNLANYASTSNNNDFYAGTPSATNLIYSDGTSVAQTIAAYKTGAFTAGTISPRDSASVGENPPFLSTTGASPNFLHINPATPTQLESGAAPIAGITDDFDGDVRNVSTPDIGADEGSFVLLDLVGPSINYTNFLNTSLTTNRTLAASVVDPSGIAGGAFSPRVYFKKSTDAGYVSTQCSGAYNCTINYSLVGGGSVTTGDIVQYFVVAQDTVGNLAANPGSGFAGTDVNTVSSPPTTPSSYTIVAPISGSVNVGSAETITSLTNAGGIFDVINNSDVVGNITINLTSDLIAETGTVGLNSFATPFTVTIKPSGAARVISGSTSANAMIRTIGASNVTIDGSLSGGADRSLTITNTSVTTPQVVRFGSVGTTPVVGNTIKNTIVNNGVNTSSAIVIGGNDGLAGYFNNIVVQNNDIRKAFIGVFANAVVTAGNGSGTVYTQNKVDNTGADAMLVVGLYLQGVAGGTVSDNTIGNFVNTDTSTADTGIWMATGTSNVTVSGNTVTTLGNPTVTSTVGAFGIRESSGLVSSGNVITRNSVSNIVHFASTAVVGISVGAGGVLVERNNVSNVRNNSTSTFGAYGIDIVGGDNSNIKNNFVSGVTGDMTGGSAFSTQFGIFGIRVGAGLNHKINNNSVNLSGLRTGTATTSLLTAALVVASTASTGLDIRNNILANNITGGTTLVANVAVALPSGGTSAMNLLSNNNSYYFGVDAASGAGESGTTAGSPNLATLPLLAAYTNTLGSASNDNASLASTGAVPFVSATDLHLAGGAPEINVGALIATVTNDIDGDGRPGNLGGEIGADELADGNAPDTSILTSPLNPINSSAATFTFSGTDTLAPDVIASFECKLDAGAFAGCTSPQTYLSLADGSHTFQVRAKDFNNNVDPTPASFTWVIDTTAPDTNITVNPTNPTNSNGASFSFTGNDGAGVGGITFDCKLDAGAFTSCSSPQAYSSLADGPHTFQVRAKDSLGNTDATPASFTWVVDTVAPDTSILTNPTNPTTSTTATFTFSGTDALAPETVASFDCKLDAGAFALCTSPQTYLGLAIGAHTFQVRARDAAGNVDASPANYGWTINAASAGPITVTATAGTVGPTDYASLKAAFDAINAGTHQGVISVAVVADVVETATAALNASGSGAASYTSVLIQPSGGAARTVSGSFVGHLVDLNGADNVTINGLNTGGNSLTFSNAALGASSTIRFANDATNNIVTNANLLGSGDASFGVVYFGAGTTTGNDGNTISNSNIGPVGSNLPLNGVFSLGTSAVIDNSGNTISGNNISDFFSAASASNGVNVNSFNSTWTISNNKVFQTATRTYTTASTHNGISVGSGSGYTITGNTIGFAAANGTGVYTMTGTVATRFVGINLAVGTTADTSVQGNTIASIAMTGIGTNSANGTLCGVNITSGNVNVGNVTPNTFGSTTGTGSLTATPTTTVGAAVIGINSSTTGTVVISNNTFGSFSSFSATAANPGSAFGVNVSGAAASMTITGNTIGNATAENIIAGVLGTTTASSIAGGIIQSATPAISNYSNNTIRNISSYGTGTGGYVRGIQTGTTSSATAVATINGNTITNLITSGATSGQSSAVTSALGIHFLPGINSTISGNTISNISNVNAGAVGTVVCGISHGSATNTVIANNVIFGLSNASTTTSTTLPNVISGILIRSGTTTTTVQNNMISLGTSQTTNSSIYGIWANHGSTPDPADKVYYNTVNIEGTAASGAAPSAAFHRGDLTTTAKFPAVDVRNNILVNTRSGGTGKHYAIANHIGAAASVATGWLANNNVLNANPATIGFWTTDQTFLGWKGASGGDLLSYSGIVVTFVNNATNLHLNMGVTPTSIESGGVAIAGITTDIDGQVRPGPAGSTNGGAFAPDIGADEFDGVYADAAAPVITYTALTNTAVTTNRTLSINVTDNTGVASGANLPRVYFKKATDAAYVSTACSLTSGTPQNGNYDCVINYALVGGGSTAAFDTIQYFVVAQDTVGNLGSNPSAGFSGTNVNTVTTPPTSPSYYLITGVFNGTYTVGTGGTFASLTNPGGIFDHVNNTTVSGNVTINIVSDLSGENGGVALNQTTETGAGGYTVTIRPNGSARTITGSSAAGIIRLSDADRVTIEGSTVAGTATQVGGDAALRQLTVQNTSTTATAGSVIAIGSAVNGAQNNTVRNVNILGQDPTQTLIGIHMGGAAPGSAGLDNDNNRIENCSFKRSFIGIYNVGASVANPNTGNVIEMNDMSATGADRMRRAGIFFFNQDGIQVNRNSIGGIVADEAADAIGIIAGIQNVTATATTSGGITNALITRNKINGIASTNTTGFSAVGIAIAGDVTGSNVISNNMITGVNAPSTSPDITAGIFVSGVTSSSTKLFFNSVSMTGNRGAVAAQIGSFGVAISGTNPIVELKNNTFYTTQISGGGANAKSYSIGMTTATFSNLSSNFNDFVSTGANAGGFRTGSLDTTGTDIATLAAWTTATTQDAGSFAVDPTFVDPLVDLHLLAGSPMINVGTAGTGVTVDFDGQTRDATPDIGADEFSVIVPGTLALSSATYSVSEAAASVTITVNRTVGTDGPVGVTYTLTDGTATGGAACGAGIDYVNTGGTVSFINGQASNTFTVAICPDSLNKIDETFNVTLSAPTGGATLGSPSAAVVTITNDDPVPTISISDVSLNEGNAGTTAFTFNVSLSAASGQTVTVHYQTADGTAVAPGDYTALPDTVLTFNPGTTTLPVTVLVNGDTGVEPNETFFVNLTTPVNATILDNQGLGTIQNDDIGAAGAYSINDVRVTEGSAGTVNAVFTVSYTAGGASAITFATANRTATAGTDYVANTNTLNFPASGSTQTQTVTVVVNGDTLKEANETFFVNLSGATAGATISDAQGVGIIVDEDRPYVSDFDRDLFADFSVFRPSDGKWYTLPSSTGVPVVTSFGTAGDRPVPGDYDGDGKTDLAYYRPSTSTWFMINSSTSTMTTFTVGTPGDKPVQGDYNGDGRTDMAVFHPADGSWSILTLPAGTVTTQLFGIATDLPVQGDYDGDGKTDLAVYRNGTWFVLRSSNSSVATQNWGNATDKPVSGDFDGDGQFDYAIYRNGQWWILNSLSGNSSVISWGLATDIPAPADFDKDGTTDITVFRPSTGDWYVLRSSTLTIQGLHWGLNGDIPTPSGYIPQ